MQNSCHPAWQACLCTVVALLKQGLKSHMKVDKNMTKQSVSNCAHSIKCSFGAWVNLTGRSMHGLSAAYDKRDCFTIFKIRQLKIYLRYVEKINWNS